jgi:hypothetical protein
MRATGITDCLKNDGPLAEARKMSNHADNAAYDRREDTASPSE